MLGRKSKRAVAEVLEAQRVDRVLGQAQLVTAAARHDLSRVTVEQPAELGQVALDHLRRARQRLLAPETLDRPFNGDGRVRAQREHRKHRGLLRAAKEKRAPVDVRLDQAKETDCHAVIQGERGHSTEPNRSIYRPHTALDRDSTAARQPPGCAQPHAKEPAVETTTHNREAPASAPAPPDAAITAAALIDSRRPRRPSRSELHGCAREGCLEIAQQQADYCSLHN
jgi:hypothetical protein